MADSLQAICIKGMILGFITVVVVVICLVGTMRIERYSANSELKRRGESRYTPDGQPNPWFFFVRDIPTIQSMSALPFLNIPHLERTEKGFKLRGRDYEATYERVSPVESEEDTADANANAKQSPPKEQPEPDYALTVVKGKTHFWKARAGKPLALHKIELHDETKPKEPSPPANAIPAEDGTAKQ